MFHSWRVSAAWCEVVQCSTPVRVSAAWCEVVQCSTPVRVSAVWCEVVQCSTPGGFRLRGVRLFSVPLLSEFVVHAAITRRQ